MNWIWNVQCIENALIIADLFRFPFDSSFNLNIHNRTLTNLTDMRSSSSFVPIYCDLLLLSLFYDSQLYNKTDLIAKHTNKLIHIPWCLPWSCNDGIHISWTTRNIAIDSIHCKRQANHVSPSEMHIEIFAVHQILIAPYFFFAMHRLLVHH